MTFNLDIVDPIFIIVIPTTINPEVMNPMTTMTCPPTL